jgi:hypothetical protein
MASSEIFRGLATEVKSTTNPSLKTFWLIQDSGARIKVVTAVTELNFADGAEVEVTGMLNVEGEVEAQFVRPTNQPPKRRRWLLKVAQAYTWLLPIPMMMLISAAVQASQHPSSNGILNGFVLVILVLLGTIPSGLSIILSAVVCYKNRTAINIVALLLNVVLLLYVFYFYAFYRDRP